LFILISFVSICNGYFKKLGIRGKGKERQGGREARSRNVKT